jgi:hypothetical protein
VLWYCAGLWSAAAWREGLMEVQDEGSQVRREPREGSTFLKKKRLKLYTFPQTQYTSLQA